jgi:hypothetical protein
MALAEMTQIGFVPPSRRTQQRPATSVIARMATLP